jgi:hypothetical protein
MMPYLESQNIWKEMSCKLYNICDQSAGFFQHELRDAFYVSGMAKTALDLQKNSKIINNEILRACKEELLDCYKGIHFPGIGSNYSKINKKYAIDSIFVLNKSIFNWEYIDKRNPNTLSERDVETQPGWVEVPGIKWNYKFHPITESALGMTGFITSLIWFYQIITIFSILLLVIGGKRLIKIVRQSNTYRQVITVIALFILSSLLMIVSNVAGWNSFSGAGNYFMIFSPFVTYLITLTIFTYNQIILDFKSFLNSKNSGTPWQ